MVLDGIKSLGPQGSTESADTRRHGFELTFTELRVYTGTEVQCFRITADQILKLQHQACGIIYNHYNLVSR